MATLSTTAPIKQAIVQTLRANSTFYSQLTGGIHEGFAPSKVAYPFLTYQLVYDPIAYTWGSMLHIAGFDLRIYHTDSVVANNLDALSLNTLNDAGLAVSGQTTLFARRVADLSSPDVDDEGRKVYMVGGTYEVWTDQPT
jgi:hypothetical protein